MYFCVCINPTSPLARGTSTRLDTTINQAIIAMKARLMRDLKAQLMFFLIVWGTGTENQTLRLAPALVDQHHRCRLPVHSKVVAIPEAAGDSTRGWHFCWTSMPRLRGTPRRGAAWYAAKSRRKRKQQFEAALALATRRRKERARSLPMAYVVEEIPEGGIPESIPEHLIFTVPENWHPPSDFNLSRWPFHSRANTEPPARSPEELPPPCHIEEETHPEETKEVPKGHEDEKELPTGHDQEPSAEKGQDHEPSTQWDCLSLIFEIRSLMGDHNFRLTRIEQRMDMYFAAHSRTHPRRQCPTYARAYAFPAGWKITGDQLNSEG